MARADDTPSTSDTHTSFNNRNSGRDKSSDAPLCEPVSAAANPAKYQSKSGGPKAPKQRQWHRRPGQKIDDLLLKRHQRHAPLSRLINQSEQRKSLTQAVCSLLPDPLANSVTVANYRPPVLVLRVGNASLATRLRYKLPELTTKLRNLADFQDLNKINLRVVQTRAPQPVEKPPRYLPAAATKSLTELANALADQPDYRELLGSILRLSEHTQKSVFEPSEAREAHETHKTHKTLTNRSNPPSDHSS